MSEDKIKILAKALYDAFDLESRGRYVGEYKFPDGEGAETVLDGLWDLEAIVRRCESAFKQVGILP